MIVADETRGAVNNGSVRLNDAADECHIWMFDRYRFANAYGMNTVFAHYLALQMLSLPRGGYSISMEGQIPGVSHGGQKSHEFEANKMQITKSRSFLSV